jgi:hypothetical protein
VLGHWDFLFVGRHSPQPARRVKPSELPSLKASIAYGNDTGMGEMRKITVDVPADDLAAAQAFTGAGVTETVRAALKKLRALQAQQRALELRGKVQFDMTWQEMKYDRE